MNLKIGDYIAVGRSNDLKLGVFVKRNPKTISYFTLDKGGLIFFKRYLGLEKGYFSTDYVEEWRTIKVTKEQIKEHLETWNANNMIECLDAFEELLKKYNYK